MIGAKLDKGTECSGFLLAVSFRLVMSQVIRYSLHKLKQIVNSVLEKTRLTTQMRYLYHIAVKSSSKFFLLLVLIRLRKSKYSLKLFNGLQNWLVGKVINFICFSFDLRSFLTSSPTFLVILFRMKHFSITIQPAFKFVVESVRCKR